jgi:hypothetical protein
VPAEGILEGVVEGDDLATLAQAERLLLDSLMIDSSVTAAAVDCFLLDTWWIIAPMVD